MEMDKEVAGSVGGQVIPSFCGFPASQAVGSCTMIRRSKSSRKKTVFVFTRRDRHSGLKPASDLDSD